MKISKLLTAGGMFLAVAAAAVAFFSNAGAASAAYILLTEYFRMPGQVVQVIGRQFGMNEPVTVVVGTTTTSVIANSEGEFTTGSLMAPPIPNTTVGVSAYGMTSHATSNLHVGGFWPVVEPSAYYFLPGQSLTMHGRGFAPNETVAMVGHSGTTTLTLTFMTNNSGEFHGGPLNVGYTSGNYSATFTGSTSNNPYTAVIHIAQLHPWVILSNYYAPGGSSVMVTARGLGANEMAHLHIGGSESIAGSAMTNNNGEVSFKAIVPGNGAGTVEFKVHGEMTNSSAREVFTRAQ